MSWAYRGLGHEVRILGVAFLWFMCLYGDVIDDMFDIELKSLPRGDLLRMDASKRPLSKGIVPHSHASTRTLCCGP